MTTPEPPERRPDSDQPTEQLPPEEPNRTEPAAASPNRTESDRTGPDHTGSAAAPGGSRLRSRRTWLLAAAGLVAVLVVGAIGFGIGRHAGHGYGRWHDGPGHGRELGMGGPDGGPGGPEGGPGGPDGGFGGPGGFGGGPGGDRGDRGDRWGRGGGMANTAMLTGSVVSVAADNLVVAPDGGAAPVTVPTNDRTRARGLGNGLTGLQPGQRVIVRIGGDKAAVAVLSPQARAMGTITALNGDRAVLVRPDGLTENVDLTAANPKPANGDLVAVTGTSAENGATLKVTELRVLPKAS